MATFTSSTAFRTVQPRTWRTDINMASQQSIILTHRRQILVASQMVDYNATAAHKSVHEVFLHMLINEAVRHHGGKEAGLSLGYAHRCHKVISKQMKESEVDLYPTFVHELAQERLFDISAPKRVFRPRQ